MFEPTSLGQRVAVAVVGVARVRVRRQLVRRVRGVRRHAQRRRAVAHRIVGVALGRTSSLRHLRQLVDRVVRVVRRHRRQLVHLRRPVSSRIQRIARSVNGTPGQLVQHRGQPRQIVVGVVGGDAVRPRHLRAAAQRVVAEPERAAAECRWRSKRRQPVQRVVGVGGRATLGIGESGAIRGCVVGVRVREVAAGQEAVARRRADQPPHVVVGKGIGSRRIVHLRDLPHQIVDVIHRRRIGIGLAGQPVQRVVHVGDRLALAVGLARQVVVGVVGVGFAQRRREIRLRHAAKGVVGERGRVAVGVLDAREIVFGVVGVVRDVARRVGDAGQPVGVVIGVRGGLAVLVGDRRSPSARIVGERGRGGVGIRDGREARSPAS